MHRILVDIAFLGITCSPIFSFLLGIIMLRIIKTDWLALSTCLNYFLELINLCDLKLAQMWWCLGMCMLDYHSKDSAIGYRVWKLMVVVVIPNII